MPAYCAKREKSPSGDDEMDAERPPLPPLTTAEDAASEVGVAEDAWSGRDTIRVAKAYLADSRSRIGFGHQGL
jgi:nuclear transport factor 2 (NTF2) superfamily protein